jgi:undecaprenyl-diphosphatase
VPLSLLSSLSFANLASELADDELHAFDGLVAGAVQSARGQVDAPMLWLTRLGEGASLTAITLVAAALLWLARKRREVIFLAAATIGTLLLNVLLKLAFRRARPEAALYVLSLPTSFSFPSGHALGSTGVMVALLIVARALGLRGVWLWLALGVTGLLVTGIATSRVYFGVHYPSDVIGGLLAGGAWISAATGYFYPRLLPGEQAREPAAIAGEPQPPN